MSPGPTSHGLQARKGAGPAASADAAPASRHLEPRGSARVGLGQAFGAVTVLNATATGIGCALAVEAGAQARWVWEGRGLDARGGPDDRVARAVLEHCDGAGARAECTTAFPAQRGLKTSSSAAAALLRAAHDARGEAVPPERLVHDAVAVARRARVTLTGALDDQAAVTFGGAHLTDNHGDRILQSLAVAPWPVAIWVPEARIDKADLARVDAAGIAPAARTAEALARRGRLPEAMTANGAAFTRLYRAAGLPVDDAPARVALEHGALGAGLSGTGPAVAALFDQPIVLPVVPGGRWQWTRAVETSP